MLYVDDGSLMLCFLLFIPQAFALQVDKGEQQKQLFNRPSLEVISALLFITVTLSRAMSSSGCCHLPGSLCDYSGNAECDASKDSEESDSTAQAQYIAKVTAKDGRPLSTVVKAVSLQR